MLLAREVVTFISKQLVKRLSAGIIETSAPDAVAEKIAAVIGDELAVEDRLNDEVRDLSLIHIYWPTAAISPRSWSACARTPRNSTRSSPATAK